MTDTLLTSLEEATCCNNNNTHICEGFWGPAWEHGGWEKVLDASKYRQKGVGYIKMSSKLCRIHFQSRPRRPPVAIIHTFVAFFHHARSENWRGHGWGSELRAENHDQNKLYRGRFEVEKMSLLMWNALCLHLELCFLRRQGALFQKNHEKRWAESWKCLQKGVGCIKVSSKGCRIRQDIIKIVSDTLSRSR